MKLFKALFFVVLFANIGICAVAKDISATYSAIYGGHNNSITVGDYSSIMGGANNLNNSNCSTILGGCGNSTFGFFNVGITGCNVTAVMNNAFHANRYMVWNMRNGFSSASNCELYYTISGGRCPVFIK